jgi:predicted ATPase
MPMVGRDRELSRVMLLLDHALAGGGRLVLCTGEAGIGKTRLAEEQALFLSERTAENHVQHILTKLGLRNRSQIAAWASTERAARGR